MRRLAMIIGFTAAAVGVFVCGVLSIVFQLVMFIVAMPFLTLMGIAYVAITGRGKWKWNGEKLRWRWSAE